MDTKHEYLSIKEFAKRAGVSRQTVYNRLDKDLTAYCKVVDKQKMLDIQALELFSSQEPVKFDSQIDSQILQQFDCNLTAVLEALKAQLEAKDKQLQAAAEEKAALLKTVAELTALLATSERSTQQAQALHAGTMQTMQQAEERTQAQLAEAAAVEADATEKKENKKRWWQFWT